MHMSTPLGAHTGLMGLVGQPSAYQLNNHTLQGMVIKSLRHFITLRNEHPRVLIPTFGLVTGPLWGPVVLRLRRS